MHGTVWMNQMIMSVYLHVEGQARCVWGWRGAAGCCRSRPSVYLEGMYTGRTGTKPGCSKTKYLVGAKKERRGKTG